MAKLQVLWYFDLQNDAALQKYMLPHNNFDWRNDFRRFTVVVSGLELFEFNVFTTVRQSTACNGIIVNMYKLAMFEELLHICFIMSP